MSLTIFNKLIGFERELFAATLKNLEDTENPLRFNNFAYACRELVRHVLHRLAPTDKVKKCSWFQQEIDSNDGVTRRQRIYYAVQGGLDDGFVQNSLEIDIADTHRQLRDALDDLSKHTHVNEPTFGLHESDVKEKSDSALQSLADMFALIEHLREEIISKLQGGIDSAALDAALHETILEIDELATHHSIEEIVVEEIEITALDENWIHLKAHGTIYVELQWGSNSDLRNDLGAVAPLNFPFTCDLMASVNNPNIITADDQVFRVDTTKWRLHGEDE